MSTASPECNGVLIPLDQMSRRAEVLAYAQKHGIGWREAIVRLVNHSLSAHVWTLTASAEGPEGGDWDGVDSVHATREGALLALFDFIHGLGIDPRDTDATDIIASSNGEHGESADLETINGWSVSYGVYRSEVRL